MTPPPVPAGDPGLSISLDSGADWGGVGAPPDPLNDCNSWVQLVGP